MYELDRRISITYIIYVYWLNSLYNINIYYEIEILIIFFIHSH